MPSGNATYTYTGDEPSIEIGGQSFTKDEPTHLTDQGVIALVADRGDFEKVKAKLSAKQIEALDHVVDGVLKPGGSPKGGNHKAKAE